MKKRPQLVIDGRTEFREFEGKLYDVAKGLPDEEAFAEAMEGADWTGDPGTGRAILLGDGRELLNPLPVAPPISVQTGEPSVNELVERALARHFARLQDDDVVDTVEDMDDFGEDEDVFPTSPYEVVLRDEAPAIPESSEGSSSAGEVEAAERAALASAPAARVKGEAEVAEPVLKAPKEPVRAREAS